MTLKFFFIASLFGVVASPAIPSDSWASLIVPVVSSGACGVILLAMVYKMIPDKERAHTAQIDKICETHREACKDIGGRIDAGNERVATLLQSTLTEMSRDR